MENHNRGVGTRSIMGVILILLGVLYFLYSMDLIYFNIPRVIFSLPFFLFMIGFLITINSRRKGFGILLMAFGGFWLLPRIFPAVDINGGLIFSVIIIGLGVYIIVKHRSRPVVADASGFTERTTFFHSRNTVSADYIDEVAVFGGGEKYVNSDNFKGGNVTAIFGGSEIHLSSCKLAEGTNIIDVLALFGGAEIRVPRDWHVIVNATPIFGGFSNKIVRDPNLPIDMSRTLIIKGLAMFGGIEVNSKD